MQSSSAPTEAAPGKTLDHGRYRLIRQIGRGGQGRVWLAADSRLHVEVAVKEVAVPVGVTAEMIERARLEARNNAQLRDNPNIVTVYDVFIEHGVPWTVMQYVPGRSLADEIEMNGPVPVATARRVAEAMLSALSACHRAGIVHRDVKPHNILLAADGTPVLTDFGIAKATGQAAMTATGMLVGSPAYLAPERANGQEATPASDLFSLGISLYHAVEGVSPFDRGDPGPTLLAVLADDLPAPARAGSLAPVILGLTAKDPARRLTADQAAALLARRKPTIEIPQKARKKAVGGILSLIVALPLIAAGIDLAPKLADTNAPAGAPGLWNRRTLRPLLQTQRRTGGLAVLRRLPRLGRERDRGPLHQHRPASAGLPHPHVVLPTRRPGPGNMV